LSVRAAAPPGPLERLWAELGSADPGLADRATRREPCPSCGAASAPSSSIPAAWRGGWRRTMSKRGWEEPEELDRSALARLRRKHLISVGAAAGRLTLPEAAAHFHALDRGPPAFRWGLFRRRWKGQSDEKRHSRQVIEVAKGSGADRARARLAAERLERELRRVGGSPRPPRPPVSS
jgi:hypothetical protein